MIISEVPTVSAALNLICFCHKKGVVDKASLGPMNFPKWKFIVVGTNYSRSLYCLGYSSSLSHRHLTQSLLYGFVYV